MEDLELSNSEYAEYLTNTAIFELVKRLNIQLSITAL